MYGVHAEYLVNLHDAVLNKHKIYSVNAIQLGFHLASELCLSWLKF